MRKSDSIIEISKALAQASVDLINIDQNAKNPFYNSKYADLPHILEVVKPILSRNGLSVIQDAEPSDVEKYLDIKSLMMHVSGEWIETVVTIPASTRNFDRKLNEIVERYDAQTYGAAITYGRRYALSALLNISSEEDNDGNMLVSDHNGSSKNVEKNGPGYTSGIDFNEIIENLKKMNYDQTQKYRVEVLSKSMTENQKITIDKIFKKKIESIEK